MSAHSISVNGVTHRVDVEPDTPLLWVLRDTLGMTGTKFGCGVGVCGACTVLMDGRAQRTCILPIQALDAKSKITTIEGLSHDGRDRAVQQAWAQIDVPQCGYCQSGQILAAVALLRELPHPSVQDIRTRMTNLCRCGTYQRIQAAVLRAAQLSNPLSNHGDGK
jgi:isoquinoline 1-oxidoreductase alpha subunit